MTNECKKYHHVEIIVLTEGGYVIREGRFQGDTFSYRDNIVAFSTISEVLRWLANYMIDRPSTKPSVEDLLRD